MTIPLTGLRQILIKFKGGDSRVEIAYKIEEYIDIKEALESNFIKVTNGSEWIHYNTNEITSIRYDG
jgi:hypothetical protein